MYFDSAIDSMNANIEEIINRGGNIKIMRMVGINMLNRMMRVNRKPTNKDEEENVKIDLEWWSFRHGSKAIEGKESRVWENSGGS